jgi:hypothetical protein
MIRVRRTVLAVVVGVLVLGLWSAGVAGAATKLRASLSGAKEVPQAGNGRGTARLTIDVGKSRVCYSITLRSVGTAVAGHIHKGGKRTAGPVFVGLFDKPTKRPKGCVKAKKSQLRAIRNHPGRYYVNVHTAKFPAGAARGQLHK